VEWFKEKHYRLLFLTKNMLRIKLFHLYLSNAHKPMPPEKIKKPRPLRSKAQNETAKIFSDAQKKKSRPSRTPLSGPVKLFLLYLIITADILLHFMFFPHPVFRRFDLRTIPFKNNDLVKKIANSFSNLNKTRESRKKGKKYTMTPVTRRLPAPLQEKILSFRQYDDDTSALKYDKTSYKHLEFFFNKLLNSILDENYPRIPINFFGDSLIAGDVVPKYIRKNFFSDFGDGGAGFMCVNKPDRGYGNILFRLRSSGWQKKSYADYRLDDNYLGINGFAFTGGAHATAQFIPYWESRVHNAKIYYLALPAAGTFNVVWNNITNTISAQSNETASAFFTISNALPQGRLELSVLSGNVTLYGAELYNHSGITFNVFPFLGAEINKLNRIEETTFMQQVSETQADFISLMFWGTTSTYSVLRTNYSDDWQQVCRKLKQALPGAAVVIAGPMGIPRMRGGEYQVKPVIRHIIHAQRTAAEENGFLFLDLFELTGGEAALSEWYNRENRLVAPDMIHFAQRGAEKISTAYYRLLMSCFRKFLEEKNYL